MKLKFFRGKKPNFGDELNDYMWQRILPDGFLDEREDELFIGIGSIIEEGLYSRTAMKHVFGSGYAGYGPPPVVDGTWDFVFVRGPRTAATLSLPREKAIADAAILLRMFCKPAADRNIAAAFMPHYQSLDWGYWEDACALGGLELIDPRDPVESILDRLSRTRVLVTEAMHGAIVADALRTPWVSVTPLWKGHHIKWLDWAEALSIDLVQHDLAPSSLLEAYIKKTGRGAADGRIGSLSRSRLLAPVNTALTQRAARHLETLAKAAPQLSADSAISRATERAFEATDSFVRGRT